MLLVIGGLALRPGHARLLEARRRRRFTGWLQQSIQSKVVAPGFATAFGRHRKRWMIATWCCETPPPSIRSVAIVDLN